MTLQAERILDEELRARAMQVPRLESELRDAQARANRIDDQLVARIVDGVVLVHTQVDRRAAPHRVILTSPYYRGGVLVAAADAVLCTTQTASAAEAIVAMLREHGVGADRG